MFVELRGPEGGPFSTTGFRLAGARWIRVLAILASIVCAERAMAQGQPAGAPAQGQPGGAPAQGQPGGASAQGQPPQPRAQNAPPGAGKHAPVLA